MAIPLIVNGVTFQYPQQFDKNWAPTLTNWSSAVTSGMLQKAGGSFTLTAEVDFGGSFGMKVLSIKSEESNIASTGILRLANASTGIVWRNALNNANLALTVNSSNQLTFNGTSIGATTSLTNGHILVGNASNQPADVAMSGAISILNTGATAIAAGAIVNADINASAAITLSKLAPTTAYYWFVANSGGVLVPVGVTASKAVITDANGLPSASSVTSTELAYVHGVTSAVQTQIDAKVSTSGDTMAGVLNMGSNKIVSLSAGSASGEAVAYQQLPPGKILQIVGNSILTNAATTAGFVTAGLSASITPMFSTSKIHVIVVGSLSAGNNSNRGYATIDRSGTNLGDATTGLVSILSPAAATMEVPCTMVVADSPATTSSITYTAQIKSGGAGTTVTWNGGGSKSVITLYEIGQ